MITLKHFAQHWEVSPAKLRRLFRKEYPGKEKGRWEFEHDSETLIGVADLLKRKLGEPTGNCLALSQAMSSAASSQGKTLATSSFTSSKSSRTRAKRASRG